MWHAPLFLRYSAEEASDFSVSRRWRLGGRQTAEPMHRRITMRLVPRRFSCDPYDRRFSVPVFRLRNVSIRQLNRLVTRNANAQGCWYLPGVPELFATRGAACAGVFSKDAARPESSPHEAERPGANTSADDDDRACRFCVLPRSVPVEAPAPRTPSDSTAADDLRTRLCHPIAVYRRGVDRALETAAARIAGV